MKINISGNTKADAQMVSFVILVVIVITLSAAVYSYLKLYVPSSKEKCPDEVTLIIEGVSCEEGRLVLNISNRGLYNVSMLFVRLGKSDRSVRQQVNKGLEIVSPPIAPGISRSYIYSNTNIVKESGEYIVEVQPAIFVEKRDPALCKNTPTQNVHCNTGSNTPSTECSSDLDCNDSNLCTDDSCFNGTCSLVNNEANTCNDQLFCTSVDKCVSGECKGTNDPCNHGSSCNEVSDSCTTSFYRVFLTNQTWNGDLGGLQGADEKCQMAADLNPANLTGEGKWKAWISNSTISASSRFEHSNIPYKLLNGVPIANNWTDLTDGTLSRAIDENEFGSYYDDINPSEKVWTGTRANGNSAGASTDDNCLDWKSNHNGFSGVHGDTVMTNYFWTTAEGNNRCNEKKHLYCFEQPQLINTA